MKMFIVKTNTGKTVSGVCCGTEAEKLIAFYARIGIKCYKVFAGRALFN